MTKDELINRYQISSGEFRTIEQAFDKVQNRLRFYAESFSIPLIREYEEQSRLQNEYEQEVEEAREAHQKKGIVARSLTRPKHVLVDGRTSLQLDSVRKAAANIQNEEEAFAYVCKAHLLDHKRVFQELLALKGSEKDADAFRAYEFAKSSSAFSGVLKKW